MKKESGFLIGGVEKASPAAEAGIKSGWKLFRIDNYAPADIIDFRVMESDSTVRLLLQTDEGVLKRIRISKPAGMPLGLSFDPPTMDKIKRCGNSCLFCFVDQNPTGMRPALYMKDDDYRLSFLYGNFITLNRLTDPELKRIEKMQLSPLYVSVHTTNPELRSKMLGSGLAARGLINLERLLESGIKIHAQIVLCPGYNTGEELMSTIDDLSRMGPNLLTVALVPVGLTDQRASLPLLRKFTGKEAALLIKEIELLQESFLKKRKSRFLFLSDEFYNLAGFEYPPDAAYEGYPQLENGVGPARLFLDELEAAAGKDDLKLARETTVTIAAGRAAEPLFAKLTDAFSRFAGLNINLVIVDNKYFGSSVTVSGLLTGSDLQRVLRDKAIGEALYISKRMLKDESELFLDGTSISELENYLNKPVFAVSGPLELIQSIRMNFA